MRITRERKYVINMGNYESFTTGAQVEITDDDFPKATIETLNNQAEKILGVLLDKDLKEAAEVSGTPNTFILTMEL